MRVSWTMAEVPYSGVHKQGLQLEAQTTAFWGYRNGRSKSEVLRERVGHGGQHFAVSKNPRGAAARRCLPRNVSI